MKEAAVKRRPLRISIKVKGDNILHNSSTKANHPNDVEELPNPLNSSPDHVELTSAEVEGNHNSQTEENLSPENSQLQLVLYDPAANASEEAGNHADHPVSYETPSSRPHPFSDKTPRVLPAVGVFTVQCAICFKWRIVPTKEKYEEIREHILEQPFVCETAREWRPDISCDDTPDIMPDGSRLWAMDKPNIAQPPAGWERLMRIRGEGSSKFADVYYVAPSGKRLRSLLDIKRYLAEHPEYVEEGLSWSQFSFLTPKPLQEDYVRKRPAKVPTPLNDVHHLNVPQVPPIEWGSPEVVQLSGPPALPTQSFEAYDLRSEIQSAKRKKATPRRRYNGNVSHSQNVVNLEG